MVSPEPNHGIAENRAYIDYMPADEDRKRRQSIAYIMRRRKRGRKTGANSGAPVKSWGEYSEVNFRPSGSYSIWGRWIVFVAAVLTIAFPFLIFPLLIPSDGHHRETLAFEGSGIHPLGWILLGIIGLLLVLFILVLIVYAGLSVWRAIRANWPYKNE